MKATYNPIKDNSGAPNKSYYQKMKEKYEEKIRLLQQDLYVLTMEEDSDKVAFVKTKIRLQFTAERAVYHGQYEH